MSLRFMTRKEGFWRLKGTTKRYLRGLRPLEYALKGGRRRQNFPGLQVALKGAGIL
ncbi:MAG: hypothetical protein WKI49_02840 [Aquificaceae bacterium]